MRHVGTKIESKIDVNIERPILQKVLKNEQKRQCVFQVLGVEVGTKKQSKINQKLKLKMDRLLASIFNGFWWVLGAK